MVLPALPDGALPERSVRGMLLLHGRLDSITTTAATAGQRRLLRVMVLASLHLSTLPERSMHGLLLLCAGLLGWRRWLSQPATTTACEYWVLRIVVLASLHFVALPERPMRALLFLRTRLCGPVHHSWQPAAAELRATRTAGQPWPLCLMVLPSISVVALSERTVHWLLLLSCLRSVYFRGGNPCGLHAGP